MIALQYAAAIIAGYLLGSIPCGQIVSRRSAGTDLRKTGSGKTGTTNVLRTAGKKAAALVLVLDIVKGALAVIIAGLIFGNDYHIARAAAALAAIAGHSWSVFLGFKGGRGVATFIGGLAGLYVPAAIVGGIFMIGVGLSTRYMSLGSITGAVAAFVFMLILNITAVGIFMSPPPIEYVVYALIGAIFIYVMHRDNIARLVSGTERKLGEKAGAEKLSPQGNSK